jgi:serine/threonine-protein kinase HipA
MNIHAIAVHLWGQQVGALAPDPVTGAYAFAFSPAWRRTHIQVAPLTMPLPPARRPQIFSFPGLPEATFHRLPGLIADAMPDDFGNALIDAWMARQGIPKSAITTLDRLAYMGKRSMGALEFHPMRGSSRESEEPIAMQSLVEAARLAVHGELDSDAHAQSALSSILRVGTSAGGARAKAVLAWNPTTHEIRSGQFDAAPDFEHWLLKFDGVGADHELGLGAEYGRIEYAYHRMALAAGIEMMPCRLLEENGRAHFMTRRFDREVVNGLTIKHHLQTLCGMQHLDFRQRATHDYAQLFLVIQQLDLGIEAVRQAFLRMAFNVMARNCDDHTKNFSFRLKQRGAWEFAPAYDITHAFNPQGAWTNQHLMSVNGHFSTITRDDLLHVAGLFDVPRPKDLLTQVRAAIDSWPEHAQGAGLNSNLADQVAKDFCLI